MPQQTGRTFVPTQQFPSDFFDALLNLLASASFNFSVQIKPGDATTLQVPVMADANNPRVGISLGGRWRWIDAALERQGPGGGAQTFDVYITSAADDAYAASGGGEIDNTNRTPALAIVASGASPAGVVLSRLVAHAHWNGATFDYVDNLLGAWSGEARHASRHASNGDDPITPGSIGAAVAGAAAPPTAHHATHEPGGSDALVLDNILRYGTHAARPLPSAALEGVYYLETDTNSGTIFQCQTSIWVQITKGVTAAPSGSAAGDLGGTFPGPAVLQSSGQAWPGNTGWLYLKLVGGGALLWDTATGGVILRNNYDPATDRLVVAANPSWQLRLRSSTDQGLISRAPATAGAPIYADVGVFTSAGLQDTRFTKGYFGDGSDGAFTLDGAVTPAWATRAGSVYTMSRDCFCTNLTVNGGVTLKTNGWRIFCTGTFTNAGTVSNDGGNGGNGASGSTGGGTAGVGGVRSLLAGAALGGVGAGGANTTVAGGAGAAPTSFLTGTVLQLGGAGGAGGTGAGGAGAAGASGGAQSGFTPSLRTASDFTGAWALFAGGSGGGGGGVSSGGTWQNGGGGGGGGGVVLVVAQTIVHTGAFSAVGGNGGNGNGTVAGGGGGGGGGVIVVIGNRATDTGTYNVAGGAGGIQSTGGTNGVAGGAGAIRQIAA